MPRYNGLHDPRQAHRQHCPCDARKGAKQQSLLTPVEDPSHRRHKGIPSFFRDPELAFCEVHIEARLPTPLLGWHCVALRDVDPETSLDEVSLHPPRETSAGRETMLNEHGIVEVREDADAVPPPEHHQFSHDFRKDPGGRRKPEGQAIICVILAPPLEPTKVLDSRWVSLRPAILNFFSPN